MSDADTQRFLIDLLRNTGLGSYRAGDLLYASGPNTLSKLSSAPTTMLLHGGPEPSWAAVSMADDVTGVLGASHGGTGQASYVLGDLLYASGVTALSRLAGQTTTTRKFLRQTGDGTLSAAPSWDTVSAADLADFVESAQDAVGLALTDTSEIDLTYNDPPNTISATLINASIVYARLQNATAVSLLGRAANSSGVLADITASADGQVLLRNGSALAFTAPTAPAAGLTISTALVFALANDLAALEALGSTGFPVRTAANTWTQRSIVDVSNRTTITNQDGVAGNVTVDISATYVGQASLTTLGTIATGTWQATAVGTTYGGTGLAAYTLGDTLYSSATNTLARLTGNITTTRKFLRQTGDGANSAAPSWDTLVAADVPDMGANPTGTIGLAAVNGTAVRSYARSDGTPALSQAITPTWTNPHIFSAAVGVTLSNASPRIAWVESDQATADEQRWDAQANAKVWALRTRTDADGTGVDIISAARGAGTALASIALGNATNNPTYSFLGTGSVTLATLVVNGSTLPANGVYLPAANTLGVAAGSARAAVWDANGRYISGTTASISVGAQAGQIQLHAAGSVSSSIVRYSANSTGCNSFMGKSRSATVAVGAAVQSGDNLGRRGWAGDDGTNLNSIAATIDGICDGTVVAGQVPGRVDVSTANSAGALTLALRVDSLQNTLAKGALRSDGATAGVGYATGAGGTVTQGTSRTTGVTLNKVCGAITLVSAAGTATYQTFTVTNSAVVATDIPMVVQKSGTDKYLIIPNNVQAGSFDITFATTGGTTTEQPVFSFAVTKGVTS